MHSNKNAYLLMGVRVPKEWGIGPNDVMLISGKAVQECYSGQSLDHSDHWAKGGRMALFPGR